MAVPEARNRLFCGERLIHIKLRLTSGPDTIIEGGSKRLFLLDLADDSTLVKRSPRRHERESLASEQSEVREGAQRHCQLISRHENYCWAITRKGIGEQREIEDIRRLADLIHIGHLIPDLELPL